MMTDAGGFEFGQTADYKEVVVPMDGPNYSRLLETYPSLREHGDIRHIFEVHNPGQPEATVFMPGLRQEDVRVYREGRTFRGAIRQLNDTVILFNWSPDTYIPPSAAAQLEDLCQLEKIKRIKLIGISYGTMAALDIIADIKRHNLPLEVAGLITIVSPISKQDLQPLPKMVVRAAPLVAQLIRWPMLGARGEFRRGLSELRSALVRAGAFRSEPYTKDELLPDIPVLAIITEGAPTLGRPTPDTLVKSDQAARTLAELFNNTQVFPVKGASFIQSGQLNITGAHRIAGNSVPMVRDRMFEFLAQVDRYK